MSENIKKKKYASQKYVDDRTPNWNQNDENAPGYIKNRPFYSYITNTEVVILEETSLNFNEETYIESFLQTALKEGQIYIVNFNGTPYECVARDDGDGGFYIGNTSLIDWEFPEAIESNEPFFISTYDDNGELWSNITVSEFGTYNVSITNIQPQEKVVKIDNKFISDEISDWKYIKNKPFGITETKVAVLEEITVEISSDYVQISDSLTFEEGKTYIVYFNGTQYECVAYELHDAFVIGSGQFAGSETGNNEPFLFVGGWNLLYSEAGEHTISITTIGKTLNKIDNMYLPEVIKAEEDVIANLNSENPVSLVKTAHQLDNLKRALLLEDIDTGCQYVIQMKSGRLVTRIACKEITITKLPDKINYINGEEFDPTGMEITVSYYDGTSKVVTDYTYSEYVENNNITITYVDGNEVSLTVNLVAIQLVDFTYDINDDGTVTLTGWNQTLNGEPSTRCVVPDNSSIIIATDNFVELPNS